MIALITGGVKSGKSARALELARRSFEGPRYFLATAEPVDAEMRRRIARHQEERGDAFITIEEKLDIDKAIADVGPVVVDCIPLWVNNLLHYQREEDFTAILDAFIWNMNRDCIVVTNETGLGNIPFDETTRHYNILLAEANRKIAAAADRVELMVSGIPLKVK
ncbi:MAG: bifunctional adenosylcobinamide kinase/adenosylcobinamide-phosphate guanylyltransferase [Treponema sp.]|nr:bifunctional adenosylcobinamide kinase/adenosylcobinamide-phosphate guanylyltransferase [Treponema sp.]